MIGMNMKGDKIIIGRKQYAAEKFQLQVELIEITRMGY